MQQVKMTPKLMIPPRRGQRISSPRPAEIKEKQRQEIGRIDAKESLYSKRKPCFTLAPNMTQVDTKTACFPAEDGLWDD
jgi:hypothetical protein